MGTSDLTKDLRGKHVPSRSPLQYALEHCLMCARAYGLMALDGEHAHAQYMRWYKLCLYTYTLESTHCWFWIACVGRRTLDMCHISVRVRVHIPATWMTWQQLIKKLDCAPEPDPRGSAHACASMDERYTNIHAYVDEGAQTLCTFSCAPC
jgi:hypothetical protein